MKRPLFYWSDLRPGGGMPVIYTLPGARRVMSVWTGVWGVSIGRFFIGVTRGSCPVPVAEGE